MIYELAKRTDRDNAVAKFKKAMDNETRIELKFVSNTRTARQNRSLHKFFVIISETLNEIGQEFTYTGLKGFELSTRYTPDIVKNFFWRPIQLSLFELESTKGLDTKMINEIADVIIKFFGEKGVLVEFPRKELE